MWQLNWIPADLRHRGIRPAAAAGDDVGKFILMVEYIALNMSVIGGLNYFLTNLNLKKNIIDSLR